MRLRPLGLLERTFDAVILGILVVVAIRTDGVFTRSALLLAAILMLLGWFVAWRRR